MRNFKWNVWSTLWLTTVSICQSGQTYIYIGLTTMIYWNSGQPQGWPQIPFEIKHFLIHHSNEICSLQMRHCCWNALSWTQNLSRIAKKCWVGIFDFLISTIWNISSWTQNLSQLQKTAELAFLIFFVSTISQKTS